MNIPEGWPDGDFYRLVHCMHGLDMRVHPRCYLCKPFGTVAGDYPMPSEPSGGIVIRPYVGPMQSGSTSSVPWCGICQGWHIPGAGPCTATYSVGAQQ